MRRSNYYFIVALLLIVGIGYAALSSNLGIRGLGSYKSNTWDVYLDNLIDNSAYSEVVSQASINEDRDSISFQVNLDDFEDKYIFYTDVVNNGTIDAMIDNLEVTGLSNEVKKFIDVKVTYKDGIAVNRYDLLKENSRDTLKVECSYKENIDITDLPDTDGSTSLTITIDYVLADDNAREREHGEGDVNAPVITLANTDIKQGINGWVNQVDFTYRIEDKDAVKSVKYCVSTEECSPNIEATLQDNEFNYSFGTSNQSQLICVEAVDIFGNTTKECSDSYLVDTDAPEISSFEATASNNTISVEVTASDSLSGISKYYYSRNGGGSYEVSDYSNYTFTNLDDGNYNIMAYVEDEAGNIKKTENKQVEITYHAVYAILYDDGTLALNSTGSVNENKTVVSNYGKLYNQYSYVFLLPWYSSRSSITTVDIEDNVRPVSTVNWFNGLSNLTEILHIENLDTSSVTDMHYMFVNCNNLTTLDVSHFDTSKVIDMKAMFTGANKIETLDVSRWDVSKVTDMSQMFSSNTNLTTLDVSRWDVSNVIDMSSMFNGCGNLATLDVSKWNVSKVENMSTMFTRTSSLLTLDVSKWNVSNVTDMGWMFLGCSNITSLDVSKWNTSKVTDMSNMFLGVSSLTVLDVSRWDVSNVTNMSSMFYELSEVSILNVSNWDVSNVTDMSSMFSRNFALEELDVSKWNVSNVTNMYGMFIWNTSLTELDLSNWDVSNVTDMSSMFFMDSSLTNIDLSKWNVSNVTNMNTMFANCIKLEGLDLSKWDTRNVTNFTDMFSSTSGEANSKVWYYGPNSINLYDNRSTANANNITFEYKSN